MLKKKHDLLQTFCERTLHRPLQMCAPASYNPDDVLGFLWPLNEMFRPNLHQIKTISYRKQYERAADSAIEGFVLNNTDWGALPFVVLRVLLERHQQTLEALVANLAAGTPVVMHAPEGLASFELTKFSVAFWYYSMKLPYKARDQAALDIESPFVHLSGKLH